MANQAIVADAVTPKAALVSLQGFAPQPWIGSRSKPGAQKSKNEILDRTVEFCNLLFGGASDFDSPSLWRFGFLRRPLHGLRPMRRSSSSSEIVGSRRSNA